MSKILGIDLGTTNSAMAVMQGGNPEVLENSEGNRTTPSVAAINKSGERLVGLLAKRQAVVNPKNTIYSIKRLIGRNFEDEEVQKDIKNSPFEIRKSEAGGVEVQMGEKWYKPEEISSMILAKLKADAEAKLGEKIEEAVITVPAYFDDSQRQATKNAGEIAGFKVKRIINEPTAAALSYGLNKKKNEKIVVYDFGGGTFDVSVLEIGDDVVEVKSTGGDTHLGGDDFDSKIIEYLLETYKKEEGIDLSNDPLAIQRLKEASEKAKHELSNVMETEINIPYITSTDAGPKHFLIKLSRAKLESLVKDLIDKSIEITEQVVKDASMSIKDLDEAVLVGGQTRMPAIQEAVKNLLGKEPHKGINPDEVVAIGAATQAGIFQGDVKDVLLLDVIPLSLGIETLGGIFTPVIEKNTTIPTSHSQIFSTAADNQPSVEIHILQGERSMASDNKTLGRFVLDGIPPAPRGVPQVEVSFDIDANGILQVSAKDKATDKEQSIKIEASTQLSKEEVEKLKKDAVEHSEKDKEKKEEVETRNEAEQIVYSAEKNMKEWGDKVDDETKSTINKGVDELKEALKGTDTEKIKASSQNLISELQKIGQKMYNENKANENNSDEKKEEEKPNEDTDEESQK